MRSGCIFKIIQGERPKQLFQTCCVTVVVDGFEDQLNRLKTLLPSRFHVIHETVFRMWAWSRSICQQWCFLFVAFATKFLLQVVA